MRAFSLTINEQQIGLINAALLELPYKHVAGLIDHLNAEIKKNMADEPAMQGPTPIKPKRAVKAKP